MISRLRGTILEKQPPIVLLELNGVGYEVHMPITCFYKLPEIGQEVILLTEFIVREDVQLLYGFNDNQERTLFRELIKVNGVGPKLALAILSGMSAYQFVSAIEQEAIAKLVKLPGIGKKTAERLVVEMKDRFKKLNGDLFNNSTIDLHGAAKQNSHDIKAEAVSALISLGYNRQDASSMIGKVAKATNCEALIREALRAAL
ncbi:Holliday junction ATP-dependent DNA helicase RuvA [Arsenophonus endosymbiont of Aleurodicus dispersus]|uniref:Holliday junction branch migration protein RuvA n=1 Tax=Arsenophonus endosymbiont of Aleurodicus dispersus TaxID=235559 RepID=UPI000EAB8D58|nr:Holliday junction branch migration protein RuvA [Arsenophonus endosymbiont of Aleurodicus dispersus]VAY02275.1 Holliday junction ATP-dependent DNA helicase RuvA [Arsenophonus endosymbiont of Aleurodicus dispersus]